MLLQYEQADSVTEHICIHTYIHTYVYVHTLNTLRVLRYIYAPKKEEIISGVEQTA
jgi:hypothetical protein